VAQGELVAGDATGEIVHQFFFAHGKAFNDPAFLALERFAFEYLRDAPPQEINAGLNVFLERVRRAARQNQQARAVGNFEIVDVAAVHRRLGRRMKFLDHLGDGAAAAGSRQTTDEYVVPRRG
jgi:hypothetical protein